jgi:hypothetical protein
MSDGFLKALDAEIAEVEAKLAADPLYIQLLKLRDLRKHYAPVTGGVVRDAPSYKMAAEPGAFSLAGSAVTFRTGRRVSPEREQATKYAREFIEGRTDPTRMDEIFNYVAGKGVQIGGQDPKSNLSAMLSKTDGFVAHGRSGWTYQPSAEKNEAPADRHPQGASEPSGESGTSPEPAQDVPNMDHLG